MNLPAPSSRRQHRTGRRWLAAAASGILQFAAFPPVSVPALAFVALVPLFWAAFQPEEPGEAPLGFRRRFLMGFLSQTVFFAALLHWILLLSNEEVTVPGLMVPALLFMAAYLSLFFGAAVGFTGLLEEKGALPAAATLPVLWTLFDRLRSLGELAFPWGSMGYSQATTPAALQVTAWTGYWALPFWILAVNGAFYAALAAGLAGRRRGAAVRLAGGLLLWAAPMLFGWVVLSRAPQVPGSVDAWPELQDQADASDRPGFGGPDSTADPQASDSSGDTGSGVGSWELPLLAGGPSPAVDLAGLLPKPEGTETFRVALVQADTPREIKWREDYREIVVGDLLERTRRASRLGPDLIVWPETAAPVMVLWWPELAKEVRQTIASIGRWVLIGTLDAIVTPEVEEHYNAAILIGPDGIPVERYFKSHLVPFSEAMPFHKQAPWLGALNFGQSDFSTGPGAYVFHASGQRFAVLICFESIFPELSRDAVADGARYLVNTTNDFWFGRSAGPVQHAEMAIHRAVENRTPMARCANTGISFFVDPYGRVYGATDLFVQAMPVANLSPGTGGSFYTRHGDWFSVSLCILAGLSLLSLIWTTRGRRKP